MKDREVEKLIVRERKRAKGVVNLIASENRASKDVQDALASEFGDKYAEGYPGRRYYGGNAVTDELERTAQKRALKLFKLSPKKWSVNVQPYSGSPANLAALVALVPPGGKVMGMRLDHGGHLTHGHGASATGKFWKQIPYGVSREDERIDFDELDWIAEQESPDVVIAGFTAYSRAVDWKRFRRVADTAGAYLLVDMSHIAGLVAGGAHPSPFPYADVVTTTTHKTLRGPRGAMIFSKIDERKLDEKVDKAVFPGLQGGPHMNTVAALAVSLREAAQPDFKKYAKQVVENARVLADQLSRRGWRIDNHLLLVDTWMGGAGIGGKEASARLERAGIIVNMNAIPFDTRKPTDPSGIRLGTPYETTRGKKAKDMEKIAAVIDRVLRTGKP
jgi:glycine hydroxymethyltransferase